MRNLKKPAASKRANLPRRVDYARQFLKDWQRLSHSGRYDMNRLKAVMLLLIANETHVGGDFLLIYRLHDTDGPSGSIYFARVGTHTELFE